MLFKPTLSSVLAKKRKALGIFEQTRAALSAAVDEFHNVIGFANGEIQKHMEKIQDHKSDVDAAQLEIKNAEDTINKISQIVGS